jgi:hypothetical protein
MHTHDILPEICSISTVRSGHFTIELSGLHPVVTAGCCAWSPQQQAIPFTVSPASLQRSCGVDEILTMTRFGLRIDLRDTGWHAVSGPPQHQTLALRCDGVSAFAHKHSNNSSLARQAKAA